MLKELARLVTWVALAAGILVAGWLFLEPSATGRFLVTATIRVDGREMTASQVWEARVQKHFKILPDGLGETTTVRGEALAFPLSSGDTLFLFRRQAKTGTSPYSGSWITECVRRMGRGPLPPPLNISTDEVIQLLPAFRGSCEIDVEPTVVLAGGTATPSITMLDQGGAPDGVSVVSVRVEGTDAQITVGLVSTYPWIGDLPSAKNTLVSSKKIFREDFTTEQ